MSEDLFLRIFERALADDPDFPLNLEPRWVRRLNEADADFMANADVEVLRLSSSRVAAKMTNNERSVLAISGFSNPHRVPGGLVEVDPTPGTFIYFALKVDLEVTATSAEIRNISEGISAAHPPYEGHDLDQILTLFPDVRFFELDKEYSYVSQLDRVMGSYCAKSLSSAGMRLSDDVCDRFSSLFEADSDEIPFFILLRGMLSASHQILFLDLYRCVEQLYPVPKVSALSKKLNVPGSIRDISKMLEETISWRPKEDEAISSLFADVPESLCISIRACFGDTEALADSAKSAERAARRVYKLRNASVHFRATHQDEVLSEECWGDLIGCMLSVVSELYRKHGKIYHCIPN